MSQIDDLRDWLVDILSNGPMSAKDIITLAGKSGISKRSLYRAKHSLEIKSICHFTPEHKIDFFDWVLCLLDKPVVPDGYDVKGIDFRIPKG